MMSRFVPDMARFDNLSIGVFFAAMTCLAIAIAWLSALLVAALCQNWKRVRWPVGLLFFGLLLGSLPLAWAGLRTEIDLGPRDEIVDSERHLTLTGWDRPTTDYRRVLRSRRDAVVLQIANPDVTDEVVSELQGMERIRELDLNDTAITDDGLAVLAGLPALRSLRLARTKITEAGFLEHLSKIESLDDLDVRETAVTPEDLSEWSQAKPGRRSLPRASLVIPAQ